MKPKSMMASCAALALLAVLAGGPAAQGQTPGGALQTPGGGGPPPSQSKINLTLEQRYTIKEIIKDAKIDPVPASTDISLGATVPGSVHLNPMPDAIAQKVPQIKSHMFFVRDNKVVIVDPKDGKIVDAIE
jgi:Protein of unknown function (DUF1236)